MGLTGGDSIETETEKAYGCVHDCNDGQNMFVCLRCKEVHRIKMPMSNDEYVRKSRGFILLHLDCKEPEGESKSQK